MIYPVYCSHDWDFHYQPFFSFESNGDWKCRNCGCLWQADKNSCKYNYNRHGESPKIQIGFVEISEKIRRRK